MIHPVRATTSLPLLSIIILFLISYSAVAGTFRMSDRMKDSLFSSQKQQVRVTSTGFTIDADWEVMNDEGLLGTDGDVYSMTYKNNYLYICGEFTTVGNIRAKNIARWNGSKWEPFGPEKYLEKSIYSLIFSGDTNLFAITSDGFYLLNGGNWKKLGKTSEIESIVYTADNQGNLIVGGSFEFIIHETQNNETELTYTKNIARWNATTQTWGPLGSEFPKDQITALTCDLNGIIYAAGTSLDSSTTFENYILKWDGSSWSIIASDKYKSISSLDCLACDRLGNLYVGGIFDTISGIAAQNIAKWNGQSWSALGEGIKGWARKLAIDQNGILYSTGFFESQDQGDVPGIACWDGNSWTVLGTGAFPKALETGRNGTLYICGDEMTIGSLVVGQIAQFSAGVWSALGKGINGTVAALTIDPAGNLICGGTFTSINGVSANHIVKWNGSRWSGLGKGVDGDVYCLHFDCKGKLYVGGTFKNAGDKPARGIAQWDGNQWHSLGDGINGKISAIATDCNGNLYAGGLFDTAGTVPAKNIAQWNGTTWLPLGAGFNAKVNTLYYYGNNLLCAGGAFTLSGNDTIRYIAEWNGSSWSEIYPDLDTVLSLTGDARGNLYSAFNNCVAVFNKTGDQWVFNPEYELLNMYSIGVSLDTKVSQVFYNIDGNLYFRKGTRIYRWKDNKIDSLICDVDRFINAFAVSGNDVYIGGNFFKIGDTVSAGIARFFFRDKNSVSDYIRAPSLNNNFRFRLSRSKLIVNNFSDGDQIALYSVSGALLRKGVCGIPLDCSGIARQPVVIRISRSGKTVYSGMLLLQ